MLVLIKIKVTYKTLFKINFILKEIRKNNNGNIRNEIITNF